MQLKIHFKSQKQNNLLIITENFTYGGLETQLAGQIRQLNQKKWKIRVLIGKNYNPSLMPIERTLEVITGNKFVPTATVSDLITTIDSIIDYINMNSISIIHAHPFQTIFPSYMAAALTKTPLIITLHGPASLYDYYGGNYASANNLALDNSTLVAVSPEVIDILRHTHSKSKTYIIPNAVNMSLEQQIKKYENKTINKTKWLVVSRLDSEKTNGIKVFLKVIKKIQGAKITIAGAGTEKVKLQNWCKSHGMTNRVEFIGFQSDITQLITSYDIVGGMGRVVLEGISRHKITCLIGYDGPKGLLTDRNIFEKSSYANFSGRYMHNINSSELLKQYKTMKEDEFNEVINLVKYNYNEETIWDMFTKLCDYAKPPNKNLAIKLYKDMVKKNINTLEPWYYSSALKEL